MINIAKNTSNIEKHQLVHVDHWPVEKQHLSILVKGILIRATDKVGFLAIILKLIAVDFSVCYQAAENNTGLIEQYKSLRRY